MTATTILHNTTERNPVFKYSWHPQILGGQGQSHRFLNTPVVPGEVNLKVVERDPNTMVFVSDQPKVFMTMFNGPYHFFHETVAPFLYQFEKTPEALFIFDIRNMYEMDEKYLKMFSRLLSKLEANFRFIKTDESTNIVADNFYTQTTLNDDVNPGNAVYDLCRKFIITEDVKPFRKVYLSRKSMGNRDYEDTFVDGPSFKNDNRIDNEEILENFFTSIGFEVVSPDIKFETFEDQVKFFYETETLVHLTGGGGTNAIFMQPRSNIVELVTTMVVNNNTREDGMKDSEEALHHFYSAYAFNKDHNYISIQNKSRKATDIVNKINNDKLLSAIFERITT